VLDILADVRMMQLNIKSPEMHRLAKLLAKETGETITVAVTQALRQRLDRVRREKAIRRAFLIEIGKRCAALLQGPPIDHADLLYDENGLPK
jgi:antitoxin VapB